MKNKLIFAILCTALFCEGAVFLRRANAWAWDKSYTVDVYVCSGTSKGASAVVTLYGNNGYYGRQTGPGDRSAHLVRFNNVPGGSNVYNRIDVDLQDGTHGEYYNNRIYKAVGSPNVSFSFCP